MCNICKHLQILLCSDPGAAWWPAAALFSAGDPSGPTSEIQTHFPTSWISTDLKLKRIKKNIFTLEVEQTTKVKLLHAISQKVTESSDVSVCVCVYLFVCLFVCFVKTEQKWNESWTNTDSVNCRTNTTNLSQSQIKAPTISREFPTCIYYIFLMFTSPKIISMFRKEKYLKRSEINVCIYEKTPAIWTSLLYN